MNAITTEPDKTRGSAPLLVLACIFLAIQLQLIGWPILPPDMPVYVLRWYQHILDAGPIGAFSSPFSNYTPPYLYLLALGSLAHPLLSPFAVIKLISIFGTVFLAISMAALLRAFEIDRPKLNGALVFLVPTVVINGTLLAQCDALWAGAGLLAVAAMLRSQVPKALLWCGVAISFKAQAIFLAPFIIGILVAKRPPWWQWLVPPLVFAAAMLPAWLAGWPAGNLASVYLRQAGLHFGGNLANVWAWAPLLVDNPERFAWLGYAVAGAASVLVGWMSAASNGDKRAMLCWALLSALILPWLLPKMHERYFFLADVLAVSLALTLRNGRALTVAIAVQLASLSALAAYAFTWPTSAMVGALIAAAAILGTISIARRKTNNRWSSPAPDLAR